MPVDLSGVLYDKYNKAKKAYELAYKEEDYKRASSEAALCAEVLRKLSKENPATASTYLEQAKMFDDLSEKLKHSKPVKHRGSVSVERGDEDDHDLLLDMEKEFDDVIRKLISRSHVDWDSISGLETTKDEIKGSVFFSLAKPDKPVKMDANMSKILLYGPPGTGKTMLAEAVSNRLSCPFFNVSVDKLLSRYVGDSPRLINSLFKVAKNMAPSVVFLDEIECLVENRDSGKESATGVVQTFLSKLEGFRTSGDDSYVLFMAASNTPWSIDPAILQRFEKKIYVPLPDREARIGIFKLHLDKKGFQCEVPRSELAKMTKDYSGRDIKNLCKNAVMLMLRRANPNVYEKADGNIDKIRKSKYRVLTIKNEEIMQSLIRIKPLADRQLLARYEDWGKRYGL